MFNNFVLRVICSFNNFILCAWYDKVINPVINGVKRIANWVIESTIPKIINFFVNAASAFLQTKAWRSFIELIIDITCRLLSSILPSLAPSFSMLSTVVFQVVNMVINTIFHTRDLVGGPGDGSIAQAIAYNIQSNMNNVFQFISCAKAIEQLKRSPQDFSAPAFGLVNNLVNDVIKPSAMVIFSLVVMTELFQITTRTEGMRNSGFEAPFKLMIKVSICKIFLDNTQNVLMAIYDFSKEMLINVYNAASGYNPFDELSGGDIEKISNLHWMALLLTWLSIWILYALIIVVLDILLPFIVLGRMLEIYMMIALSPLPFATFAHQEFSQVGKNFLKQFIGLSLKSVVLYLIILVYSCVFLQLLVVPSGGTITDLSDFIWRNIVQLMSIGGPWAVVGFIGVQVLLPCVIYCFMLVGSVLAADKYTKMITGAFY